MPELSAILQSPYLWAAAVLALGLVAFLLGMVSGSQQERRRTQKERKKKEQAGYSLAMGLSSVIAGNPDLAIRELRQVVEKDTEAVEIYILLGDLYRERGRVEQAIRIHKAVLKRPGLSHERKTAALASLSRDFAKAGFVDRALRTFREVSERDPASITPLHYLVKLHEEEGAWEEALATQQRLLGLRSDPEDRKVTGFLHWRVGLDQLERGQNRKALRSFSRAVSTWPRTTPAHLSAGDAHLAMGDESRAEQSWLAASEEDPDRAWLALERLAPLWEERENMEALEEFARRHSESNPHEWRIPLIRARRAIAAGDVAGGLPYLKRALQRNPRSMEALGLAWRLTLPDGAAHSGPFGEILGTLEEQEAFADSQICLRCRYRTTELLWQCPHCRAWDSFRR